MTSTAHDPNRPTRAVLIAGEWPASERLVGSLSRRGLMSAEMPDRDRVLGALTHNKSGALLLPLSNDRLADTTLLLRVVESDNRLAVVVVGEAIDATDVAHFVRQGAAACLELRQGDGAVVDALTQALERRESLLEADRQTAGLRAALREITRQLQNEAGELRQRWMGSLESLVRVGEACHSNWSGHSLRVADLAGAIAVAMGEDDATVEKVRVAGRLHDLGMIGIPVRLLEKSGPLSEREFEMIKHHPVLASEILASYPELGEITRAIRGHHENWDGSGYPDRLAGQDIPPMARILAGAEVFDALTSPRPYKRLEDTEVALEQLTRLSGTALDPAVCRAIPLVVQGRRTLSFVEHAA